MPHVQANNIEVYYEVQGEGEPLVLIPYLAADQACYAFQVADYAKRFTCYTVDLRGAGLSSKPEGIYTTELLADDMAAFMQAVGITRAHVSGLSLGAATGMWLAAKYPSLVKSLSLHSAWTRTDPFVRVVVEGWQTMAQALGNVWAMSPAFRAEQSDTSRHLSEFQMLEAEITRSTGDAARVSLQCRIDTVDELDYFRNGGILHYVLRNLAA